MITKML